MSQRASAESALDGMATRWAVLVERLGLATGCWINHNAVEFFEPVTRAIFAGKGEKVFDTPYKLGIYSQYTFG